MLATAVRRAALGLLVLAGSAAAQPPAPALPFSPGERLAYRVRVPGVGTVGRGAMTVEGPVEVRDHSTLLLKFEFSARFGLLRAVNRSDSWLDPERMAVLRFYKHERGPAIEHDELVELFPDTRRWEAATGRTGASKTDAPLDELSFLYFLRTVPLEVGETYHFNRHFDPSRNPVTVKVLGRERIRVPAGEFDALAVEMRVKDPGRYGGEGVLRIHLTDAPCRIPLQIRSSLPVVGSLVLSLESHTHPAAHLAGKYE